MASLTKRMRRARELGRELVQLADATLVDLRGESLRRLSWPVSSDDEFNGALSALRSDAELACSVLQPERAIPALVDAITTSYAEPTEPRRRKLGAILKVCLGLTWPNVHRTSARVCTTTSMMTAVGACGAWAELFTLSHLRSFSQRGEVWLKNDQLVSSEELERAKRQMHRTQRATPTWLRSPKAVALQFMSDVGGAVDGLRAIARGEAPADIASLRDTLLIHVPPGVGDPLWAYLWTALHIAVRAVAICSQVHGTPDGVVLLAQPIALPRLDGLLAAHARVDRLFFWEKAWSSRLDGAALVNALAERPLVRCDNSADFYATSPLLMADSFATAIETAFFAYPGREALHLPDPAFQAAFAEPFEDSVIQICRAAGWDAGRVSAGGVWSAGRSGTPTAPSVLGRKCPGEIDCLAVSHDRRRAWVLECKVLKLPFTFSTARNVSGKLGGDDSESFHSRLAAKVAWVESIWPDTRVAGAIVVDRIFPNPPARHPVVLDAELSALLNQVWTPPNG